MKREFHVRFCEKLGGRFPLLTRPVFLCCRRWYDSLCQLKQKKDSAPIAEQSPSIR